MELKSKESLFFIVKVALALAILTILFHGTSYQQYSHVITNVSIYELFIGFAFFNLTLLMQGVRWQLLLRQDTNFLDTYRIQKVNYLASFFDLFVPGKVGSDGYRIYSLKKQMGGERLFASLVFLRMQGALLTLVVSVFCGIILLDEFPILKQWGIRLFISVMSVTLLLVCLGLILNRKHKAIQRVRIYLYDRLKKSQFSFPNARLFALSSFVYLLFLACVAVVHFFVLESMGVEMPTLLLLLAIPLMLLASMVPITLHGRGLVETIGLLIWSKALDKEEILVLTTIVYFYAIIQGAFCGLYLAFSRKKESSF